MSFRSFLYRWARIAGDVNAAKRGWRAIFMRIGRKAILREVGRQVNRIR